MTEKPKTPLHRARKAAAKELGVPSNDRRAIRLATLLVAYDYVQAQLAVGQHVDIGHVLKLDAALAEIRMAVTPPPKVRLEIVGTDLDTCPSCGFQSPAKAPKPPLDSKRTTDVPIENGTALAGGPESAIPADDSKVVEIEIQKPPLWEATGYVPAQPFGDGAPTAPDHGREAWRPYAHAGNGYAPDPAPWRIVVPAGHPLPTPGESK